MSDTPNNQSYQQMRPENTNNLIGKIKNTMEKGDSILFKASNGMKLFEIVQELRQ